MENSSKNRSGILVLFDIIAILIGTFGTAVASSLISQGAIDGNLFILCILFAGIKLLILGLGDFIGITQKFWKAVIAVIIGNGIVIAINYLMSFSVAKSLLFITTAVEIVLVICSHLLWKKIFKKSIEQHQSDKEWLAQDNKKSDDAELIEIHSSINDPKNVGAAALSSVDPQALKEENTPAATKPVRTVTEIRKMIDNHIIIDDDESSESKLNDDQYQQMLTNIDSEMLVKQSVSPQDEKIIGLSFDDEMDAVHSDQEDFSIEEPLEIITDAEIESESEDELIVAESADEEVVTIESDDEENNSEEPITDSETFENETVEPLDAALSEEALLTEETAEPVPEENAEETESDIEETDITEAFEESEEVLMEDDESESISLDPIDEEETESDIIVLSNEIDTFKNNVDQIRIESEDYDDIQISGALIKEKMDHIIEKQNIVDGVVKDLLRFSEQINEKFDEIEEREKNLNALEKKLQERADSLENINNDMPEPVKQADLYSEKHHFITKDEVIIGNADYDIIADPEDLSIIQAFLKAQNHDDQ